MKLNICIDIKTIERIKIINLPQDNNDGAARLQKLEPNPECFLIISVRPNW